MFYFFNPSSVNSHGPAHFQTTAISSLTRTASHVAYNFPQAGNSSRVFFVIRPCSFLIYSCIFTHSGCYPREQGVQMMLLEVRSVSINLYLCLKKVELLKNLKKGTSIKNLRECCSIRLSNVYDLKKQKERNFNFFFPENESQKSLKCRKTLKVARDSELDRLHRFFQKLFLSSCISVARQWPGPEGARLKKLDSTYLVV